MSMISRNPTECSSSPTVPHTNLSGNFFTSSLISSSLNGITSSGITSLETSISKPTLAFISILVPSASCITSRLITSGSKRPIFLPISTATTSATLLLRGRNMVSIMVPSANHSISGLTKSEFLYFLFSAILTLTLSSISSSSM